MWTKDKVAQFILDHPIDCSWRNGRQVPGPSYRQRLAGRGQDKVLSPTETVIHEDGYGADVHHEVKLLPNLRHCPQHTLQTILHFMHSAVDLGDVTIWNHPDGDIRIMFTEQINPGP